MKKTLYEEEGVATAVGTIFVILIFILVLGLFVNSYVPAEMTSYEQQYSSGIMNDMMQFMSVISILPVNFHEGELVSATFNLQSNYLPLFSSPTLGTLSLTASSAGKNGYLQVGNSSQSVSAGGCLSVLTNNRYFVDEAFYYEFSSLLYQQHGTNPVINSSLQFNLIQLEAPTNGSINLAMDLVNLVGGPLNISSTSSFVLTAESLSLEDQTLKGNFTLTLSSQLGYQIYKSVSQTLSSLPLITVSHSQLSDGSILISIHSPSGNINLHINEITVLVGINSSS